MIKNLLKNNKKIVLFSALICLFLFFPLYFSSANVVTRAIMALPLYLISFFFMLIVLATAWIPRLILSLLMIIASGDFLPADFNYTSNVVIDIGLAITRNFVNLILVIILIYVAVNIALSLDEKNSKKLFINLLLVALLVNFAPLLVGLIVDFANIITNYFLSEIADVAGFSAQVASLADNIWAQIREYVSIGGDMGGAFMSIVGQGMALIFFNIFASIIFGLFTFLFLFRHVAIWVLVILSPLAVVSYVIPSTKKKYFDKWLSAVYQWSFISIPMSFFLYLGLRILEILPGRLRIELTGLQDGAVAQMSGNLLPYFVVLVFLYIGFMVSLSISAPGAGGAAGIAKKAYSATQKRALSVSRDKTIGTARKMERVALNSKLGAKAQSALEKVGQSRSKVARGLGITSLANRANKVVVNEKESLNTRQLKEGQSAAENMTESQRKAEYSAPGGIGDGKAGGEKKLSYKAGVAMQRIAKGDKISEEEAEDMYEVGKKTKNQNLMKGATKAMLLKNPKKAEEFIKNKVDNLIDLEKMIIDEMKNEGSNKEDAKKAVEEKIKQKTGRKDINEAKKQFAYDEVTKKINKDDLEKVKPEMYKDEYALSSLVRHKSPNQLRSLEEDPASRGVVGATTSLMNRNPEFSEEVLKKNPSFLLRLYNTSAGGIMTDSDTPVNGWTEKQLKNRIRYVRGNNELKDYQEPQEGQEEEPEPKSEPKITVPGTKEFDDVNKAPWKYSKTREEDKGDKTDSTTQI